MSNLTSVGLTAGSPTTGTGTVSTIDALMADGGQATIGAKTDAASTATDATATSVVSILKQISASSQTIPTHAVTQSGTWTVQPGNTANTTAWKVDASSAAVPVTDNSGSLTVDNGGTFAVQAAQSGTWNVTNVSGTVSLPTGAATAAKQPALGTAGTASTDVISVQGIASMTALKTDSSATTQPVSAASLPLPSGAATAAKQPALGTAGSASSDVISVQGVASMTALKVDNSAVTQPISAASLPLPSGASTAAKQPALGTAGSASSDVLSIQGISSMTPLLSSQSGNWSTRTQDGSGNSITSATRGSERALTVQLVDGSGTQITTFGGSGGTSSNLGSAIPSAATAAGYSDGTNMQMARVFDADSGAGTQYVAGVNLRGSSSGGSVEIGTSSNPIQVSLANTAANSTAVKVDGSAVTQPVSISGNQAVNVAQINGVTPLMGNGVTGTGSQRVTVASDNTAFAVNPVSATVPVSTMNSASANSGVNSAMAANFDDTSPTSITENSFGFVRMSANRNLYGTIRDAAGNERGANVDASNRLSVLNTYSALGQTTMSASMPMTIASDQTWTKGQSNKGFAAAVTTLTRPANTTAYSAADSISNNATAGSVTALSATVSDTNDDIITLVDLLISSTDTGLAGKRIRAYLFNSDPTASTGVGGGDNAAFSQKKAGYIGSMSGVLETGFSDGTVGRLTPSFNDSTASPAPNNAAGSFIVTPPTSGAKTIYVQYQAIDAFTPSANSTTIIGTLRGYQSRTA